MLKNVAEQFKFSDLDKPKDIKMFFLQGAGK